jgi:hypothetical protein
MPQRELGIPPWQIFYDFAERCRHLPPVLGALAKPRDHRIRYHSDRISKRMGSRNGMELGAKSNETQG